MITCNFLINTGYTMNQSTAIMRKLKQLGCETTSVKKESTYDRNGVICNHLAFVDAIHPEEAWEKLRDYIETDRKFDRKLWESVLHELEQII